MHDWLRWCPRVFCALRRALTAGVCAQGAAAGAFLRGAGAIAGKVEALNSLGASQVLQDAKQDNFVIAVKFEPVIRAAWEGKVALPRSKPTANDAQLLQDLEANGGQQLERSIALHDTQPQTRPPPTLRPPHQERAPPPRPPGPPSVRPPHQERAPPPRPPGPPPRPPLPSVPPSAQAAPSGPPPPHQEGPPDVNRMLQPGAKEGVRDALRGLAIQGGRAALAFGMERKKHL